MATNLRRQDNHGLPATSFGDATAAEIRAGSMPALKGEGVTVRGLRAEDAESFFSLFTQESVTQFLMPPPPSIERFARFIEWARTQQEAGRQICFALVPGETESAAGLIQVRQLEPGFAVAEWGFAVGQPFWGTGLFPKAARLVLSFLFEQVGVRRLEARTVVGNERANRVLEKLGANQEGILRQGFSSNGRCFDQVLWSILADEWDQSRAVAPQIH
jgi:ribosomal-protein-alanine N-acetyltransferase